jgi:hypothetical protein
MKIPDGQEKNTDYHPGNETLPGVVRNGEDYEPITGTSPQPGNGNKSTDASLRKH